MLLGLPHFLLELLSHLPALAPSGGSRRCSTMSAIEGKPDGRPTRPEPTLLTRTRLSRCQLPRCETFSLALNGRAGPIQILPALKVKRAAPPSGWIISV
jgi:hypothetical protein